MTTDDQQSYDSSTTTVARTGCLCHHGRGQHEARQWMGTGCLRCSCDEFVKHPLPCPNPRCVAGEVMSSGDSLMSCPICHGDTTIEGGP